MSDRTTPHNIDDQLAAARALLDTVAEGFAPRPSSDAAERACNLIFSAMKRTLFAEIKRLQDATDKMEVVAHVCVFLGEMIGESVAAMPPKIAQTTLRLHIEELAKASGLTAVTVCAPFTTTQQQETKH